MVEVLFDAGDMSIHYCIYAVYPVQGPGGVGACRRGTLDRSNSADTDRLTNILTFKSTGKF